jgi:asparagine N-glycosylation enzyme membrane subunit Stt3
MLKSPFIKHSWILGIVVAIYVLSLLFLINRATANTGGKLTYIYDDAYIHMAMAKNLVNHGVWGATPHEFTSTTSSPILKPLLMLPDCTKSSLGCRWI